MERFQPLPGCSAGFVEGQAVLRLVEQTNGNVALVVAGYSALDTRRAARVLADFEDYSLSSDNVVVQGSNAQFTDITVSEAVEAVAEPVVEEATEEVAEEPAQ